MRIAYQIRKKVVMQTRIRNEKVGGLPEASRPAKWTIANLNLPLQSVYKLILSLSAKPHFLLTEMSSISSFCSDRNRKSGRADSH